MQIYVLLLERKKYILYSSNMGQNVYFSEVACRWYPHSLYKRSTVQMTIVQSQQSKFSNSRFILLDGKSIGVAEGQGKLHHNSSPQLALQHSEAKRGVYTFMSFSQDTDVVSISLKSLGEGFKCFVLEKGRKTFKTLKATQSNIFL